MGGGEVEVVSWDGVREGEVVWIGWEGWGKWKLVRVMVGGIREVGREGGGVKGRGVGVRGVRREWYGGVEKGGDEGGGWGK